MIAQGGLRHVNWRRGLDAGLLVAAVSAAIVAAFILSILTGSQAQAPAKTRHRIVYQVSSNDPPAMQHALSSADNAINLYRSRGETVAVEIVANGGGMRMMRADTTPVGAAFRYIRGAHPDIVFSACGNTKTIMEANEGHALTLLEGVQVVPAGIVRVVELQEQGYAYVKP